jgi:hypothetical protein
VREEVPDSVSGIEIDDEPTETDFDPRVVPVAEDSLRYIVPAEANVPDCLAIVKFACVPLTVTDMRRRDPQVPSPLVVEVGEAE